MRCSGRRAVVFGLALLLALSCAAQVNRYDEELRTLQEERVLLTEELSQFEKTLLLLLPEGDRAADSANPAITSLADETTRIRKRLIAVTEREVFLVQERIALAGEDSEDISGTPNNSLTPADPLIYDTQIPQEAEDVARLLVLLNQYYSDLRESLRTTPSAEELARQAASKKDAATLANTPFSEDKLRLNGAEGFTALARISQRLADPNIANSRRDTALICAIKTRLAGELIASENRSLRPVGKNQYIARAQLRPGQTTLRVLSHQWTLELPQDIADGDHVITLVVPKTGKPEMHIFAVADLLAQKQSRLPVWLPDELNLQPQAE